MRVSYKRAFLRYNLFIRLSPSDNVSVYIASYSNLVMWIVLDRTHDRTYKPEPEYVNWVAIDLSLFFEFGFDCRNPSSSSIIGNYINYDNRFASVL